MVDFMKMLVFPIISGSRGSDGPSPPCNLPQHLFLVSLFAGAISLAYHARAHIRKRWLCFVIFRENLKNTGKDRLFSKPLYPSPRSDKYFVTCFESFFSKRQFTSSEFVPVVSPPLCPLHDLPLGPPRPASIFMYVREQASTLSCFSVFLSHIVICVAPQLALLVRHDLSVFTIGPVPAFYK